MGSCAIRQNRKSSGFKLTNATEIKETQRIHPKITSLEARHLILKNKDAKAPILNLCINPLYLKRTLNITL
ncbi:hypothetical protein SteCoe_26120 [Stentor coeruleus]|uniref:Uncharacterized protein n=1 Tax=Stentor coeruleus TaxID=5963 RepID=A0A1R2BDN2_9CILI|nr:hypothetical protein SteCoe_26120 [Stentor coeruleus]